MPYIKKNPSRTVDATEQTRFSKSRPNDLEDIGQGQRSSHATHPLVLLIICTKYGKNPFWTVDATGQTRKVNGQTDRQTGWIQYNPPNFVAWGIKTQQAWNTPMLSATVADKQRYLMPQGINAKVSHYYICWHSITIICSTFVQQLEICN